MLYGILLAILVLDGLFLGMVILLQAGKGDGLAAMGGGVAVTEGILAGRQATSVLQRATWISGSLFMALALVLSVLSSRARQPQPLLLQDLQQQTAPIPEPILPGLQESEGRGSAEPPPEPAPGNTREPGGAGSR